MACPTCTHTMQRLDGWHWCPRCGTIRKVGSSFDDAVPSLVKRCRQFEERELPVVSAGTAAAWTRIGIAESINPPGERP